MAISELCKVAELTFIEPDKARFYTLDGDFLGLEYDGADKKRVSLHRALPVHRPGEYVCVLDGEGKEIGIIRDVSAFPKEQADYIERELAMRYFSPDVLRILSSKEKMGYVYFELVTAAGKKTVAVKDVSKSIRQLDEKRILIVDVEGNRYVVPDFHKLDRAGMRCLEAYLF